LLGIRDITVHCSSAGRDARLRVRGICFVVIQSLLSREALRVIARHPTKGGANGGAGESGRDGARSPDPGAGAMQGRRRRAAGREAECPPSRCYPLVYLRI